MKSSERHLDRKLEIVNWLFRQDDDGIVAQFEALVAQLQEAKQTPVDVPKEHLEAIARGDADIAAGNFVSLADFKKKYARYGI
jgi:hypothetical protein